MNKKEYTPAVEGLTDEQICKLADMLWEQGHISDLSRDTAVIFARALLAASPVPMASSAGEPDADLTQALEERDRYHDAADDLANYIAEITGDDIGEHSSANDPWASACDAARGYLQRRPEKADERGSAEPSADWWAGWNAASYSIAHDPPALPQVRAALAAASKDAATMNEVNVTQGKGDRPCTCHPDDRPQECQKQYAASDCQKKADERGIAEPVHIVNKQLVDPRLATAATVHERFLKAELERLQRAVLSAAHPDSAQARDAAQAVENGNA